MRRHFKRQRERERERKNHFSVVPRRITSEAFVLLMASIPCSPRHSVSGPKDTPNLFENPLVSFVSPPSTPALQYFNIRVTERLHRYRSLRRQWQEVGTPKSPSPMPNGDLSANPTVELKVFSMSESNSGTMIREHPEKSFVESEALQSRIQQDLIKLRRLIKARQKKLAETGSGGSNPPKARGVSTSNNFLHLKRRAFLA